MTAPACPTCYYRAEQVCCHPDEVQNAPTRLAEWMAFAALAPAAKRPPSPGWCPLRRAQQHLPLRAGRKERK